MNFDRRITIQRKTVARNALNDPRETWDTLTTVYANRRDASAGESYRASEVGAELTARFTIRWSTLAASITASDRISHLGELYNITQVRETARGRRIEIDAVRRNDQAAADVTDESP